MKKLTYVTSFVDRHGKRRYRFRRKGYDAYYFREPFGTKAFEREYAACMSREPRQIGKERTIPGSVADVIIRYYADNSFLDLRESTKTVYRGVLERFRASFGTDLMRAFNADRIAKLMTTMRGKPHAAARLRKLLAQLFVIARRAQLVPAGFDPIKDTRPPKAETKGYHSWTEDELEAFEAKHPLGTRQRLAYALLLYGAQRSGDVRLMTAQTIAGGRIRHDQSKTGNQVDVPVVTPLREALDAGPLGTDTLIETPRHEPYSAKNFYQMFKVACRKAGLDHCSPHGLRKSAARRCREAGCTVEEGMAITGHTTEREYRRYAGTESRGVLADAAMGRVLANQRQKVATRSAQAAEKSAQK